MPAASMKDWLSTNRLAPSWLLSVVLHAALIWLLLTLMPTWERPPAGFGTEPTREIGIFLKERGENIEPSDATGEDAQSEAHDPSPPKSMDPLTPPSAVPDFPTDDLPLPKSANLPAIGPGAVPGDAGIPDQKALIKPSPGKNGSGQGSKASGGIPGAAFMGVKDEGTRVVFVVDASGSMLSHNAMRTAKAALVSSLQSLEPAQQFQIIFYNESPRVMSLKSAPKKQLYFATDVNKNAARQFINGVEPDLGTSHLDAIKLGLSFGPEVMFVLTDSGEPVLTPSELEEIQRRNRHTRIHCIEFGVGKELGNTTNFLKKLARQNEGTHRYVDVMDFSRK